MASEFDADFDTEESRFTATGQQARVKKDYLE